jgi:5-methylcytosine-specific restriction endonuclease McrA
MSGYIPSSLAQIVRIRARFECEYCRLPQASQEAAFHLDHVQPRSIGGPTDAENLALACVTCSLKKSSRTVARDPETKAVVPLFNPRRDRWADHFAWTPRCRLVGLTATGRATIAALGMNRPAILIVRRGLAKMGEFLSS